MLQQCPGGLSRVSSVALAALDLSEHTAVSVHLVLHTDAH